MVDVFMLCIYTCVLFLLSHQKVNILRQPLSSHCLMDYSLWSLVYQKLICECDTFKICHHFGNPILIPFFVCLFQDAQNFKNKSELYVVIQVGIDLSGWSVCKVYKGPGTMWVPETEAWRGMDTVTKT